MLEPRFSSKNPLNQFTTEPIFPERVFFSHGGRVEAWEENFDSFLSPSQQSNFSSKASFHFLVKLFGFSRIAFKESWREIIRSDWSRGGEILDCRLDLLIHLSRSRKELQTRQSFRWFSQNEKWGKEAEEKKNVFRVWFNFIPRSSDVKRFVFPSIRRISLANGWRREMWKSILMGLVQKNNSAAKSIFVFLFRLSGCGFGSENEISMKMETDTWGDWRAHDWSSA